MPAPAELVGVAIAIPSPHSDVLTEWRRRVGDPAAELTYPHVTLLPPTRVANDDEAEKFEQHLEAVAAAAAPFEMHLAGTGTFRPLSPVVVVQIARGVADCELLERAIRNGPLPRDLDFPYHPHVTVAQDIDEAGLDAAYEGLAGFTARFPVGEFALFSRDRAGQWTWRRAFLLTG
jgi:2'-5' RNA ligase